METPDKPEFMTGLGETFREDCRWLRYLVWQMAGLLAAIAGAFKVAWAVAVYNFFLFGPVMTQAAKLIARELMLAPIFIAQGTLSTLVAAWRGAVHPEYILQDHVITTLAGLVDCAFLALKVTRTVLWSCIVTFWSECNNIILLEDLWVTCVVLIHIAILAVRLACWMSMYLVAPALLTFAIYPCPYFTAQVVAFEVLGLITYGLLSP